MSAKAEKKESVKQQENLMYLGPDIVGVVRHSVVFKNGVLPERIRKCIKEFPMMEKLFVEVGKIPGAIRELNKKQSVMGTIYTHVADKFNRR